MYSGVSPSTAMSDISSSTLPNMSNNIQQQQSQLVQPAPTNTFVTQPMENSFGPDHIINDLFFPMDIDSKRSAEYNMRRFTYVALI